MISILVIEVDQFFEIIINEYPIDKLVYSKPNRNN